MSAWACLLVVGVLCGGFQLAVVASVLLVPNAFYGVSGGRVTVASVAYAFGLAGALGLSVFGVQAAHSPLVAIGALGLVGAGLTGWRVGARMSASYWTLLPAWLIAVPGLLLVLMAAIQVDLLTVFLVAGFGIWGISVPLVSTLFWRRRRALAGFSSDRARSMWQLAAERLGLDAAWRPWGLEMTGTIDGFDTSVTVVSATSPVRVRLRMRVPGLDPAVSIQAGSGSADTGNAVMDLVLQTEGEVRHLVDGRHEQLLPALCEGGVRVREGHLELDAPGAAEHGELEWWPDFEELERRLAEMSAVARVLSEAG